jgi:hypothetical protein
MRQHQQHLGPFFCEQCFDLVPFPHDHAPDGSGLDDGPYLPGCAPRKKMELPANVSEIRKQAWATRRAKYGKYGHR